MGQNNSKVLLPLPIEVERRPPPRPEAPPSSRPLSELGPKAPSYYNPQNKVLPMLETDTPLKRLRPVSLELSKFHPEFKDIFKHDENDKMGSDSNKMDDKESDFDKENLTNCSVDNEEKPEHSSSNNNSQNGHIPRAEPHSILRQTERDVLSVRPRQPSYKDRSPTRYAGHRRQLSASALLTTADNIIHEVPEEYAFEQSRGKMDSFNLSYPITSLPQKSSFDMDYAYNVTYAQLAEARREKNISELEKKTGIKLNDLSMDLSENMDIPLFYKGVSQASTRSMTSTEMGVSRKKKRAPPRPTSISQCSFENDPPIDYDIDDSPRHNGKYSPLQQSMNMNSSSVEEKKDPPKPPPPPLSPKHSGINLQFSAHQNYSADLQVLPKLIQQNSAQSEPKTPKSEPELLPWLLEIKTAAIGRGTRQQISETGDLLSTPNKTNETLDSDLGAKNYDGQNSVQPTLIFSADNLLKTNPTTIPIPSTSTDQKALNGDKETVVIDITAKTELVPESSSSAWESVKNDRLLSGESEINSTVNSCKREETGHLFHRHNSISNYFSSELLKRQNSTTSSRSAASEPPVSKVATPTCPIRRLNSLLQYDIQIAAKAKATKLVKHTTPVKPKPKEPHQVFQEQLAKACAAREERMKDQSVDEHLHRQNSQERQELINDLQVKVKKHDTPEKMSLSDHKTSSVSTSSLSSRASSDMSTKKLGPSSPQLMMKDNHNGKDYVKKERLFFQNGDVRRPTKQNDDLDNSYSKDWIPEDDLGSDDDLSDRETMTSRKTNSEGFKSSIIPNRVNDLKSKGKEKKNSRQSDSLNDRAKYGSIKKFKKSVHKGMKTAFGSVSRASGKIFLKKYQSQDLDQPDDAPKNWKLTNVPAEPIINGHVSSKAKKYIMDSQSFEFSDEKSDEEDEPKIDRHREKLMHDKNGDVFDCEESDTEEKSYQYMKRAGVAYISGKGQIVVLPEFENVKVDYDGHIVDRNEGRAPRIVPTKKKFAYAATMRRKEQAAWEEHIAQDVQLKEQQRELEKQKQLQAEQEMQRHRDIETQQRLHQLEAAHMQQHLHQHQTQTNLSTISAPPLPPASGLPGNITAFPNYFRPQGYVPLWNPTALSQMSIPNTTGVGLGTVGGYTGSMLNPGIGNTPYDLSEYMRMLGMQPPSNNAQQFAYLLSSMNYNSPVYDMLTSEQKKYFLGVHDPTNLQFSGASKGTHQMLSDIKMNPQSKQFPIEMRREQGFPVEAQPTIPNSLRLNDFVSHHNYDANEGQQFGHSSKKKERNNPVYFSSDDSDEDGLSPTKTGHSVAASLQVKDYMDILPTSQKYLSSPDDSERHLSSPVGSHGYMSSPNSSVISSNNITSLSDEIANRMEYLKEQREKS